MNCTKDNRPTQMKYSWYLISSMGSLSLNTDKDSNRRSIAITFNRLEFIPDHGERNLDKLICYFMQS